MADDLHLLGIGYRHVKGGEDDFARAGDRVKTTAKEAAASVAAVDAALASMEAQFAGVTATLSATTGALQADVAAMQAHRAAAAQDAAATGVLADELGALVVTLDAEAAAMAASVTQQREMIAMKRLLDAGLQKEMLTEAEHARLLGVVRERYEALQPAAIAAAAAEKAEAEAAAAASTARSAMVSNMAKMAAGLVGFGSVMALAAGAVAFVKGGIDETRQWAEATNQLNAALENTGGVSGMTVGQMQGLAVQIQNTTKFTDDQTAAAEAMMLTYTRVTSAVFPRAIELSADLATRMGTDLSGAAQTVGKALQDPEEGLGALNRQLRLFDNATEQQIKNMMRSGDVIQAQNAILAALESRVGGAGEAGQTAFDRFSHATDDLQQAFGDGLTPALADALALMTKLSSDENMLRFVGALGTALGFLVRILTFVVDMISRVDLGIAKLGRWAGTLFGPDEAPGGGDIPDSMIPQQVAGPAPKLGPDPAEIQRIKEATAGQKQQAEAAEALYAAYQRGLPAVEAMNRQQAIAQAQAPALAKGDLGMAAALGEYAAREYDAHRATEMFQDAEQRRLSIAEQIRTAQAAVTDAVRGNSEASRAAATAAEVEQIRIKNLWGEDDKRTAALKRQLAARDLVLQKLAQEAAAAQRDRQYKVDALTAEAALADAVNRNAAEGRELAIALEIEQRLRDENLYGLEEYTAAQANEVAKISDEVRVRRGYLDSLSAEAQIRKMANESVDRDAAARASIADAEQYRRAVDKWGEGLAGILQQYGLLSDATKHLAIEQQVQAKREEGWSDEALGHLREELEAEQARADAIASTAAAEEYAWKIRGDGMAKWAAALGAVSEAMGGSETSVGKFIGSLGQLAGAVSALKKAPLDLSQGWSAALKNMSAETADALIGIAGAVSALWESLGLGKKTTAGGFGGSGEGNYAPEGQAIGAVIGAIIGAFYGAPEVGAAIGSAAGGILGSLVGKGADQALGYIEFRVGEFSTMIQQSEHKLGMVIGKLGESVATAVNDILNAIGGSLLAVPLISVKVRDGVIKVVVGTVSGWFKDMGDAVSFAVAEILKQSTITGISSTIKTILSKTDASDLDQLGKQLDFGKWYDSLHLGEAGTKIADAMAEFREKWNMAVKFGLDTAPIGRWFAEQMASIKNAMLGVNDAGARALAALASFGTGIDSAAQAATDGLAATQAALDALLAQIADMQAHPPGNSGAHDDMSGSYGAGGYGGAAGGDGMGHGQAPTGQSDQSAATNEAGEWATLLAELQNQVPALRAAIEAYLAQLSAIPAKLTKEEQDLGIWTALDHYLQGTKDYAAMAHKFAVMRAQIELNLIKLEIQKMDTSLALWQEWSDIWQQAWNLTLDPNFGKPGKGAGGGGNKGPSSLQQAIIDSQRELAMGAMGDFQRQVAQTNTKWDDLIKEAGLHSDAMAEATRRHEAAIKAAHGNADAIAAANAAYERAIKNIHATAAEIAEANHQRELELQLIRDQAHERVDSALHPQNQWESQAADIQKAYEDIRKANQALRDAGVKGVDPKWRVNAAERAEMAALAEKAIDSLGLPMEALKDRVQGMGDALAFAKKMADEGIISQERYGEVLAQVQQQAGQEVMGMAADLLDQMGNSDEAAKLRRMMQVAEFELQRAQLNFLYQQYHLLRLLSPAVEAALTHALEVINGFDPNNLPLPGASGQRFHGYEDAGSGSGTDAARQAEDDAKRRKEILDQIAEWNHAGESAAASGLRDLRDEMVAMQADAARLGISLAELAAANANAVADFWDQTLEPYESGRTQNLLEQAAAINDQFDELIAAAREFGGDEARIQADRASELERFWNEALQPIRDLREEFSLGQHGGQSPEAMLTAARSRFEELAARAQAGDASAIASLPGAVNALLEQQRAFSGTGPAYQALVATIQGVLDSILALPAGAAGAAPAANVAGLAPAAAGGLAAVRPASSPPIVDLPGGGSASEPVRLGDERVDRLAAAMERDTEERDARRRQDELQGQRIALLLDAVEAQQEQIGDLTREVERLASLVESQERRRAG